LKIVALLIAGGCLLGCAGEPEAVTSDGPIGMAAVLSQNAAFGFETSQTEHFRIHSQPGTYASEDPVRVQTDLEESYERCIGILDAGEFGPRIDAFYLRSREEMARAAGVTWSGLGVPEANAFLRVRDGADSTSDRHELMHVLSHNLWGPPNERTKIGWMSEVLAMHAGGPIRSYPIHEMAADLARQGKLIPLAPLIAGFDTYDEWTAYTQAGSFAGYVIERYGTTKLRELWHRGPERMATVFGKDIAEMDAEWTAYLRESYPDPQVNWSLLEE